MTNLSRKHACGLLVAGLFAAAPSTAVAQRQPLPPAWVTFSGGMSLLILPGGLGLDRTAGQGVLGFDAGLRIAARLGVGIQASLGLPIKTGDCHTANCGDQPNEYRSAAGVLTYSLGRSAPLISAGAGAFRFEETQVTPDRTQLGVLGMIEIPVRTGTNTTLSVGLRTVYLPNSKGPTMSLWGLLVRLQAVP